MIIADLSRSRTLLKRHDEMEIFHHALAQGYSIAYCNPTSISAQPLEIDWFRAECLCLAVYHHATPYTLD